LRILSISNCPLDPNLGSGRTVLRYSAELRNLGHNVDILAPIHYEIGQRLSRGKKFRQALGAWWTGRRKIGQRNYDVIEYYGDEFWLLASTLSRRRERPLLVAHTNGLELLAAECQQSGCREETTLLSQLKQLVTGPVHHRLSEIAFRSADAFVALCKLDVEYVVKHGILPRQQTAVVGPGLDTEFLDRTFDMRRGTRVAFNGSWIGRKGVDYIVSVMTRLLDKLSNLHFDVFGTGGRQDSVLSAFPDRFRPRIHVHLRLSNAALADALTASRVFFFPSRYEGFGMATAEAMARGCAPVVTPTGFGAELRDGVDGFVVPFADTGAMETRIEALLADDACFERISRAAQARVAGLRWDRVGRQLAEHYEAWSAANTRGMRKPA